MSRDLGHLRQLLLVEDNPGDADLIIDSLTFPDPSQNRVVHVATLSDAVAHLKTLNVDAVLLDLRLPDGAGVECVTAIRLHAGDVPIVVLTGMEDDEKLALSCIAAGAQDYLSKEDAQTEALSRSIGYAIARVSEATERRRADAIHARHAAIVEASSDAIVSCSLDGTLTSWNRGAERMFNRPREEAIGQSSLAVMQLTNDRGFTGTIPQIFESHSGTTEDAHEFTRVRDDGTTATLSVVASALQDANGEVVGVAAICRDITESKRQAEELKRLNSDLFARDAQMRALNARLTSVREEERTRISRAVHDELGQLLTGLKMDLRWVGRRLGGDTALGPTIAPKLGEAEKLVDRTIETVQRIAVELRPSALDALGLAAALRDEARRFQKRTNVIATVEVQGDARPEQEIDTALFRVFQELLTNVARHARATRLSVLLDYKPNAWTLKVEDNGVGIPNVAQRRSTALGLLGINERVNALGGAVSLERGQVCGTVATIVVPQSVNDDGDARKGKE